mgnify:CR=1 FL=1
MMIAMLVRHLTENFEARAGKRKLLLLLDEFTALGKVEILERALAYLAGYGVRAQRSRNGESHLRDGRSNNRGSKAAICVRLVGRPKLDQSKRDRNRPTIVDGRRSDANGSPEYWWWRCKAG